ncbi:MAG TPA: carbohydrate-binding protein, partial [Ignavibacteriales bacterium]|nr:carbohydrate-binding protein [Ignavibacteriales bacterium]
AATGDYEGTEINSSRQLWSIAGNLAMVYRIFFGMEFGENGLKFSPFIPKAYEGTYTLNNFKYRGAVLDITVKGFGSEISSMLFDGQKISSNKIAGNLTGRHTIEIELNKESEGGKINLVKNVFSPETPDVSISNGKLTWSAADNIMYEIYKNGELLLPTEKAEYRIENNSGYAEYQVKAVQKDGLESFLSEPIAYGKSKPITVKPANVQLKQKHAGYSGEGYAELENSIGAKLEFEIDIPKGGDYAIDFRYANGNGSLTGENMCAVRTLIIDGEDNSVIVLPQRGENVWDNWGYTNSVMAELTKGKHTVTLEFKNYNENMNGEVNFALIDYLRAVKPED